MMLFALNSSSSLGSRIADKLGCPLSPHEEREFSCGEHKSRPLVGVWGEDVYIVSSLHGDCNYSVNDKICRLLFFIGAMKDAGASQVTAVMPYFAYSRKDRRTKSNDPVTTHYVAAALESVGVDRVVTMDIHNVAAFENSFGCPSVNLPTVELFAEYFHRTAGTEVDTIVSPDLGGLKSTRLFCDAYMKLARKAIDLGVMDKKRSEGVVSGMGLIGEIGQHVLIVDDMIGSGSTMCRAASACRGAGARSVMVGATHGLFENRASMFFDHPGIDKIVVTDSVAIDNLGLSSECLERIVILESADLLAECIREMQGRFMR